MEIIVKMFLQKNLKKLLGGFEFTSLSKGIKKVYNIYKDRNENKKRALITGINGQDGSYLAEYLLSKDYQVFGTLKKKFSR